MLSGFPVLDCCLLVCLISGSAFFSGSETSITSMNRYRLQHLVRKKNAAAKRIYDLLLKPDRLLSMILIGNTVTNIAASALATMIAVRYFGSHVVWLSTIGLTLVVLVFAEVMPKTIAVLYPERFAFLMSHPLKGLSRILYPLICLVTYFSNGMLRLFSVETKKSVFDTFSVEELRGMLASKNQLTAVHQNMLLGVLDLEAMTVNDVMLPRQSIIGINLNQPWAKIVQDLNAVKGPRLLAYNGSVNHPLGFVYLPKLLKLLLKNALSKSSFIRSLDPITFIPEGTLLTKQLNNFKHHRISMGLIVDEYGEVAGLISLDDIIEEILGEFVQHTAQMHHEVEANADGSYWLSGSCNVRDLNRRYQWQLPVDGPNTLSGLIIEYLEFIPKSPLGVRIAGYPLEVLEVQANKIERVRILPSLYHSPEAFSD